MSQDVEHQIQCHADTLPDFARRVSIEHLTACLIISNALGGDS